MKNPHRLIACAVLFAASTTLPTAPAHAADRPNVLFIAIDDLNDWIGCLSGHPQTASPNIDRLAQRGVLFTNAHCQAPICCPSRVSLMTGMLPSTTGVYLLEPKEVRDVSPALADKAATPTLPEHFAAHGYRTMGVGKVYHNCSARETFQEYGPRSGFGPRPEKKIAYPIGHPLWDLGVFPNDDNDDKMPDKIAADWVIARLEEKHDKPFFLAAGFVRPHVPLFAPPKWFAMHADTADVKLPPVLDNDTHDIGEYALKLTAGRSAPRHAWMVENGQWHAAVKAYLACVSFVDHHVGRVLEALDDGPYADNTIVVIWSDHGWALGEKQRWAKRALWERETKVPLMFAGPGITQGAVCPKGVGLIDMYPTLTELCGIPSAEHVEGASLVPLLRDPRARWERPTITTFWKHNHAIRSEHWRYIHYADGSEELYDHRVDPNEWRNLASDSRYRTKIAELKRWLPKVNVEAVPDSRGLDGDLPGVN